METIAYIAAELVLLAILAHLVEWAPPTEPLTPVLSPEDHLPLCRQCGRQKSWALCWHCPVDEEEDCSVCGTDGGWWVCLHCYPELVEGEVSA